MPSTSVPISPVNAAAKAVTGGPILIFTITGRILLMDLAGYVSTVIGAGATSIKITSNPTVGAATDLCTNGVITNAPAGSLVSLDGVLANALKVNLATQGGLAGMASNGIIVPAGTLTVVVTGGTTGAIDWSLTYQPLTAGALVV